MLIVALLIMLFSSIIEKQFYNQVSASQEIFLSVLLIIAIFFCILGGINVIRLREMPRPYMRSITGVNAVVTGIIWLIPTSIAEIYMIVYIFNEILK
jgi:multisubunit Na+/H+ antiporter MnhG subunit